MTTDLGAAPDGDGPDTPSTDAPPPPRTGIRGRYLAFLAVGLLLLAGSGALVVSNLVGDDGEQAGAPKLVVDEKGYETLEPEIAADGTITYVIPAGTRDRIAAGEDLAVIPASITIEVGQHLILRNEDSDAHIAGPFFVGPGEESSYSFSEPKVIEGDCTIHPSGSFEIRVVAAL